MVKPVLRLYQREGAGRPLRVRWTLEETGAPYEYVVMTPEEGRNGEHAHRHPLGRVPVLETEEGSLFESAALCLHVADLHSQAGLIAAPGTSERGQVYHLVGDGFTIADIVVGGVLESARRYELQPESPVLRAYLERLDARPAKQRAYAD